MRKHRTIIASTALAVITTLGVGLAAGCSSQLNDQSGIPQYSMDYAATYLNADSFANVTLICIRGAGFATTTRDYNALIRVPAWDSFCATKEPGTPRLAPSGPDSTPGQ